MVKITSRFKVLLAEKELRDKRSYTMRDVAKATNVSIYTITALANNTLREFPLEALGEVCQFLECTTGDLLLFAESRPDSNSTTMDTQIIGSGLVAAAAR